MEQVADYEKTVKALDPHRPLLMTVTGDFTNDPILYNWYTHEQANKTYPSYLKHADVVGFDNYPIYGWNRPDKLYWVSQGVRELRGYAGQEKPVYEWIETQPGYFNGPGKPCTGVEIRNEVYQAIIAGATAIGYFTHRFQPTFAEFGVPEENQRDILAINKQLQRLAPVILGPDAAKQPAMLLQAENEKLTGQCLAKQTGDTLVLFALNCDMGRKGGLATFTLDGLQAGTKIEVVDEDRTLSAADGKFTDDFGPLGVHIYRLKTLR